MVHWWFTGGSLTFRSIGSCRYPFGCAGAGFVPCLRPAAFMGPVFGHPENEKTSNAEPGRTSCARRDIRWWSGEPSVWSAGAVVVAFSVRRGRVGLLFGLWAGVIPSVATMRITGAVCLRAENMEQPIEQTFLLANGCVQVWGSGGLLGLSRSPSRSPGAVGLLACWSAGAVGLWRRWSLSGLLVSGDVGPFRTHL